MFSISFSAIETLKDCPYKFFLAYKRKEKPTALPHLNTIFGKILHEKIRLVLQNSERFDNVLYNIGPFFTKYFYDNEIKLSDSYISDLAYKAEKLLQNFVEIFSTSFATLENKPLSEFEIGIPFYKIVNREKVSFFIKGKVDLVLDNNIFDFKTGKPSPKKDVLQSSFYSFLYRKKYNKKENGIFWIFLKDKKIQPFNKNKLDFQNLYNEIATNLDIALCNDEYTFLELSRKKFYKDLPPFCNYCEYRSICTIFLDYNEESSTKGIPVEGFFDGK